MTSRQRERNRKAGKARMAKLTPEGRRELQQRAAAAAKLKRAEQTARMIEDVLRERRARGIIPATSDPSVSIPTEDQRLVGDIKRKLDRMRATEARSAGRFVKYDRAKLTSPFYATAVTG